MNLENINLSKEIITEVLGLPVREFSFDLAGEYDPIIDIYYEDNTQSGRLILNIYEFSHLAKEWSLKGENSYFIAHSGFYNKEGFCWIYPTEENLKDCNAYVEKEFTAENEVTAIIKALVYFYNEILKD